MSKIQVNAIVLVCLCALWLAGSVAFPRLVSQGRLIEDFREIPFGIRDWQSNDPPYDGKPATGLPTASVLTRSYINDRGDVVVLTVVYSASSGDLHQPESCLLGSGWTTNVQEKVPLRPPQGKPFTAMRIALYEGNSGREQIGLYWFNSPRSKTSLLSWYKLRLYVSQMLGGAKQGSLMVRILAPVQGGDRYRSREATARFAEQVTPYLDTMMLTPPRIAKQ